MDEQAVTVMMSKTAKPAAARSARKGKLTAVLKRRALKAKVKTCSTEQGEYADDTSLSNEP